MKYLILILLAVSLSGFTYPHDDFTAAWAMPYRYAVIWHKAGSTTACVVRVQPLPETVLGCGRRTTYILHESTGDAQASGMVFELREGADVVGTVTLAELHQVALPLVGTP
jgi:hypothetical protein